MKRNKENLGNRIFDVGVYFIVILITVVCFYPMISAY